MAVTTHTKFLAQERVVQASQTNFLDMLNDTSELLGRGSDGQKRTSCEKTGKK